MRALVVYYSRTGHTKMVADQISKGLQCDAEELFDNVNRSGPIGFLKSGREASSRKLIELKPIQKDPAQYDLVIIGTPVWASNMSSPIRAYISENKSKFKEVAFFVTLGNTGAEKAIKEMEELCGKRAEATVAVKAKDLSKGSYVESINKFVGEVKA